MNVVFANGATLRDLQLALRDTRITVDINTDLDALIVKRPIETAPIQLTEGNMHE